MVETGLFFDREDAEKAVGRLHELGYRDAEISKITNDRSVRDIEGGISGALIDLGISKQRALDLEAGVARGGIIIGVTPRDRDRGHVETILARAETGIIP